MTKHTTVLLHEAIEALVTDVNGVYVDATFGRGGILARCWKSYLIKVW